MDQMWEIIGVVVAILMVIIGLRLLLKKPQEDQTEKQENFLIDEQTQQPIIPRHLRDSAEKQVHVDVCELPNQTEDKDRDEDTSQIITQPIKEVEAIVDVNAYPIEANIAPNTDGFDDIVAQLNKEVGLVTEAESSQTHLFTNDQELEHINTDQEGDRQDILNDENLSVDHSDKTTLDEWSGESDLLEAHLSQQDRSDEESALATAEQLVALYMYPNPARALSGEKTLKMLLKYGLRFGEMSCFHRYEHPEHESPLMFSVLKITDDGTPTGFDLESMPNEEIKGLAFFLTLPNPNSIQGFDMMASIAGLMARDTEGLVFDEQSLELTPQLRDHWRHFVIEYRSGQSG